MKTSEALAEPSQDAAFVTTSGFAAINNGYIMIERSLDWIKVSKLKLPLANTKYRTTTYASGVRMHFVCGLVLAFSSP